ncbi:type II toxin-antitoxin system Phd/YefM family antitoxin [Spirulina sp. 06S082]|uniref:type II toxin-antitoxin system Phd/YefM family antitoxin n=1 Tax=Spirulina sp. 06S082 TaxID=3110248 RepID=UPI002B20FC1E|nr:type II toxin-antitoxin system Phd/YefM family antitoxin [Spirulina sp. 06S082]MEA5472114.1 type II toxin-antitoxin system Phd/YefM family antitoxin [Spirulina sp. 06S082]
MNQCTSEDAKMNLENLIEEASNSHQPILIAGEKKNAILVSEEDWRGIQETLYLLAIPGMRESIQEGLKTSIKDCDEDLD